MDAENKKDEKKLKKTEEEKRKLLHEYEKKFIEESKILRNKYVFFENISNIRPAKRKDWFEAQAVGILLQDTGIMLENISR